MSKTFSSISAAIALATATLTTLITAEAGRAIVTVDSPYNHVVPYGRFSGVGQLQIANTAGEVNVCTGSLLRGGQYMRTAAHCLTDELGRRNALSTTVSFTDSPNLYSVASNGYFIYPGWKGNFYSGNDIAVVRLSRKVSGVQQYYIYRSRAEVGRVFTKVGYGNIGTGYLGERTDLYGTGKLFGQNRFDALGEDIPYVRGNPLPGRQLLFDFDNGYDTNNFFIGSDAGLGTKEINAARGDSGGPSFIGSRIAGVTSYRERLSSVDVDSVSNSSFGEYTGETRVTFFRNFITKAVAGKYRPSRLASASRISPMSSTANLAGSFPVNKELGDDSSTESSVSVPEPSSVLAILAFGVLGAGVLRKRKVST